MRSRPQLLFPLPHLLLSHLRVSSAEPRAVPTAQLRRFHATVDLNPTRIARDAGDISEAIIQHLASLVDAKVTVTLEIKQPCPTVFQKTLFAPF
jgi:hypothetical protein